jgi:CubicO group peptidase (beta-lactamase class C family)
LIVPHIIIEPLPEDFRALMQDSAVTGLATAIINGDVIRISACCEFLGEMLTEDTIWPVASLTKPVFAYGVLQLVQRGLLDLDRPLQEYLPGPYLEGIPELPLITARHAMTHSTGFPNWRDAQGLRASFRPGEKFSYSSEGLNYLQAVVEHLIGMSMDAYLKQNVFLPFGMTQTELACEMPETVPPFSHFFLKTLPANGALSLRTTIGDYARFVHAMFDPGVGGEYRLSEAMLNEMLRPQIMVGERKQLHWGLGWGLHTSSIDESFWHWGARSIPTAMNFAVGWPEQRQGMVIFTNHQHGLSLADDIIRNAFLFVSSPVFAFDWLLPAKNWRPDGSRPEQ